MGQFAHIPAFPSADFKAVVRPNFDTLYSSAWLDLSGGPVVVSAPDTGGRYYLLPVYDMWTDVFAAPGWRTTGTAAQHHALVPPGWSGSLPAGVSQVKAPTPTVWIIGRTQANGPGDYEAVHQVQAAYAVTPLDRWGQPPAQPPFEADPAVDMTTPPLDQVEAMQAEVFFALAAELMKVHPPHLTDFSVLARITRIGLRPGDSFDPRAAGPDDPGRPGHCAEGGPGPDDSGDPAAGQGEQRLVDEYRHDGGVRQLLPQARHRRPGGAGSQPA